jgi:hypothetical protein
MGALASRGTLLYFFVVSEMFYISWKQVLSLYTGLNNVILLLLSLIQTVILNTRAIDNIWTQIFFWTTGTVCEYFSFVCISADWYW